MRTYELFCLLKTGIDIENTEQIIKNIENSIENLDGKIKETNKIGRKKLAYEIGKNKDSFCVTFNIEIEPDKLKELKRYLKLNDSVLRDFITILKEPVKTA